MNHNPPLPARSGISTIAYTLCVICSDDKEVHVVGEKEVRN